MNKIVTIADKNYLKFVNRLHSSLRDCGWRGDFTVVTTDDDFYCNCNIVQVERKIKTKHFDDNRWLKFDLYRMFDEGDRILFLDADMVCFPACDFDFFFDHEFMLSALPVDEYDVTKQTRRTSEMLGYEIDLTYILGPFVFTMGDPQVKNLLEKAKIFIGEAEKHSGGTMFALNYAINTMDDFYPLTFPHSKIVYTVDVINGKFFDSPWFSHFGGKRGREFWEREMNGEDLGYML